MEILVLLTIYAFGLFELVFTFWMLFHCATGRFRTDNEKIIWLLIIVFANCIGSTIYFFVKKSEVDMLKNSSICPNCRQINPRLPVGDYICRTCNAKFGARTDGTTYEIR